MVLVIAEVKECRRQVVALTRSTAKTVREMRAERDSLYKSRINTVERDAVTRVLDCASFTVDKKVIEELLSRGVLKRKANGLFLTMYGMEAYYGVLNA